jgi:hypothetical protein
VVAVETVFTRRPAHRPVLANGKDPIARYNAIYTLSWNYNGAFTQEEKHAIEWLTKDSDEAVSRVARMIVEKWGSSPFSSSNVNGSKQRLLHDS